MDELIEKLNAVYAPNPGAQAVKDACIAIVQQCMMPNISLFERLDAAKIPPDGCTDWNDAVAACIAIVRQYETGSVCVGPQGDRGESWCIEHYPNRCQCNQQREISVVDKPDALIMACQEVLRLMDKWKTHHAYSGTCQRAVDELRSEMQKHLRTTEPMSVSLSIGERAMLEVPPEDEDGYKPYSALVKACAQAWGLPFVD